MSDDLTTGLRQLAESGQRLPTASGSDIRRLAQSRRRRRRTAAAVAGTVAAVAVASTLVLNLGGPDGGRTSTPAAGPTSAPPAPRQTRTAISSPTQRAAADVTVNLSARYLVAGGRKVPITSGLAKTPTPTGRMTVTSMTDVKEMGGGVVVGGAAGSYKLPWVIGLRGQDGATTFLAAIPYDKKAPGSYDTTSGWIGLRLSDAKWLYGRLRTGAVVDVVGATAAEPAPGGTPTSSDSAPGGPPTLSDPGPVVTPTFPDSGPVVTPSSTVSAW
ncbi:L,D-transpeptidase [Streptomyces sp. NPDC001843]|uniref:L,D-transpeptidase n=1 Tax=Streptomyces sp. NPDC001843 TaxID=3364617 RepID=UPI0036C64514